MGKKKGAKGEWRVQRRVQGERRGGTEGLNEVADGGKVEGESCAIANVSLAGVADVETGLRKEEPARLGPSGPDRRHEEC